MEEKLAVIVSSSGEIKQYKFVVGDRDHKEIFLDYATQNNIKLPSYDHIDGGLALAKEGHMILLNGKSYWLFILPKILTDVQRSYLIDNIDYINSIEILRIIGYSGEKMEYGKNYRDYKIEGIINNKTIKELLLEEIGLENQKNR